MPSGAAAARKVAGRDRLFQLFRSFRAVLQFTCCFWRRTRWHFLKEKATQHQRSPSTAIEELLYGPHMALSSRFLPGRLSLGRETPAGCVLTGGSEKTGP